MTVDERPLIRYHRVTTRRRNLRALQCPLEPELLVAELAGELPPDVGLAVREHVAVCETCGARALALRRPYAMLASLGAEPVDYVPDLRDAVRIGARRHRLSRRALAVAGTLGRGGAIVAAAALVLALVAVLVLSGFFSATARTVGRSTNKLTSVPSAAPSGTLYAETDKLVTVTDGSGGSWAVAEVIAVSQQSGKVTRSLPAGGQDLRAASAGQLPRSAAISPDGTLLVELTSSGGAAAGLVGVSTATGKLRFATALKLPGGAALPTGSSPLALAFAPDGATLYVSLTQPTPDAPHILAVSTADGKTLRALSPALTTPAPMPPPPGSLPVSSFPNLVPQLDVSGLTAAPGAGGALVVSPNGQWLYDTLVLYKGGVPAYGLARRISAGTGQTMRELAIPGDFSLASIAFTQSGAVPVPLLFLAKGSPDAQVFALDSGDLSPLGDVALGGPGAPEHTVFAGSIAASPVGDGTRLYVAQDASAAGGAIAGHDVWAVDVTGMALMAHQIDPDTAGSVLANGVADAKALTFVLRRGQVLVAPADLGSAPVPWLVLADGHPVVALLASRS